MAAEVDMHQQTFHEDLEIAQQLYIVEVIDEEQKRIKFHLAGPANTPYETGVYEVDLKFPENYPESLPDIQFITPIWNCSVEPSNGRVHYEDETRFNIAEALAFVEDLFRSAELDEQGMFYKTARFWNTEFAAGEANPEDNWQQEKINSMIEMGFPTMDAIIALSGCDWNLGEAAEQLLEVEEEL